MEYKSLSEAHRRDLTYETLKNGGVLTGQKFPTQTGLAFATK